MLTTLADHAGLSAWDLLERTASTPADAGGLDVLADEPGLEGEESSRLARAHAFEREAEGISELSSRRK